MIRKLTIDDVSAPRKDKMRLTISEMLKNVDDASTKTEKIALLRKYNTPPMQDILRACFDPRVTWLLPPGPPPYKPSNLTDIEGRLYQETKHLYLFMEGGNPNLTHLKRMQIFVQMLESMEPNDAKLLISIKDREMPYKSITVKLVNEAIPALIAEGKIRKMREDGTVK